MGSHPSVKNNTVNIPFSFTVKKNFDESPKDLDKYVYIEGYASTNDLDRGGDVVAASFWKNEKALKNFSSNPVLLFNHNFDDIVGNVVDFDVDDRGLYIFGKVNKKWSKSWAVEEGHLKTLSVHITVEDYDYNEEANAFVILEGELLEVSLASVPMNASAVFDLSKAFDLTREQLKKSVIQKQNTKKKGKMDNNLQTFMKTMLALLAAKFGLAFGFDDPENVTPEDLQAKLESLPDHAERQKAFQKTVLDDFKAEILAGETDAAKAIRKSLIDEFKAEVVAEAKAAVSEDLQALKDQNESLKGQIAKLKGIDPGTQHSADPFNAMPSSQKHFLDQYGTLQPPNKEA